MKVLRERTEIANAMNFNKYPVVAIDLAKYTNEYGITGVPCRIKHMPKWTHSEETLYHDITFNIYKDKSSVGFCSGGFGLYSSFSSSDVIKMANNANTPIVDKDMEIVISIFNSETNMVLTPIIVKTGGFVDINCTTVLSLTEEDTDFLYNVCKLTLNW